MWPPSLRRRGLLRQLRRPPCCNCSRTSRLPGRWKHRPPTPPLSPPPPRAPTATVASCRLAASPLHPPSRPRLSAGAHPARLPAAGSPCRISRPRIAACPDAPPRRFAGGASADLQGDRRSRRRSHRIISDRAVSAPPRPTARVVPRDCATRARAARLAAALCAPAAAASATLALGVVRPLVRPRQLALHAGPPAVVDGPACDSPACDGAVAPRAGDRAGGGWGGAAAASPLLLAPLRRRGEHSRTRTLPIHPRTAHTHP